MGALTATTGTFTGGITDTGSFVLRSNPDTSVFHLTNLAGTGRFGTYLTGAESSGNAGSNYNIVAYNDAGAYIGPYLTLNRATGAATFASSVSMGALTATTGTFSGLLTMNAGGSLAANYGLAIADGAPGTTTGKLYSVSTPVANTLMWNGSKVMTIGTVGQDQATLQAALGMAVAPLVGTIAQRTAYSVPTGTLPYWYATDETAPDGQLGTLRLWSGSAWGSAATPSTVVGRVIAGTIAAGAVSAQAMATNSITAANAAIADATITTAKIANLAVGTAQINNLAVTDAKINDLAVSKLTAGTITAAITTTGVFKTSGASLGTSSLTPSGVTINGTPYTATCLNDVYGNAVTLSNCVMELGGQVNFGGYPLTTLAVAKLANGGSILYGTGGTYTWICPTGITQVEVLIVGGGGGNSDGSTGDKAGGAGGGCIRALLQVNPGTSYTVTVGAGGAGSTTAAGTTGGTSSLVGSAAGSAPAVNITATGGTGGNQLGPTGGAGGNATINGNTVATGTAGSTATANATNPAIVSGIIFASAVGGGGGGAQTGTYYNGGYTAGFAPTAGQVGGGGSGFGVGGGNSAALNWGGGSYPAGNFGGGGGYTSGSTKYAYQGANGCVLLRW